MNTLDVINKSLKNVLLKKVDSGYIVVDLNNQVISRSYDDLKFAENVAHRLNFQVQQAIDSRTKLDSLKEQPKQINPHSYDFYYGILLKDLLEWGSVFKDGLNKKEINIEALESIDQITRKILELKGC